MKKRLLAVVLFAMTLTSGFAYGDGGWNPGCSGPDGWFSKLSAVANELWNYVF